MSVARMISAGSAVLACLISPLPTAEAEPDRDLMDFVVGNYALIGREPDGGSVYSGTANIGLSGDDHLVLRRKIDGHEIVAEGRFEVPSPPGEGRVLRFRWRDPAPILMTCLVGSDLDNYARLSCIWVREGSQPNEPGLEAMFPTANWPSAKP
jgi:hypothetical protein